MRNAPPTFSAREARQRDAKQFSAAVLSMDEDLFRGSPVWIARSFAAGQCVTLRVRDGHFAGWHIHEFARYFARCEGSREPGDHDQRVAFRVWCADRPDDARLERVEVDVPYTVLPVRFRPMEERVDPLHVDNVNALVASERARLGCSDG